MTLMNKVRHLENAERYLKYLCDELPGRRTGSHGNHRATDYFAETVEEFGFRIMKSTFECIDWKPGKASVTTSGGELSVFISPYSMGAKVKAPLIKLASLDEVEAADLSGKVALLTGELVKEQLMPKNFPFYNPEHHQRIIAALEHKNPAAIIAATGKDPQMAGGVYPFPLIEDGDFDIPSIYMKEVEGERLAAHVGEIVKVEIVAERVPAKGDNIIARKGNAGRSRLVICAHIDAKEGTPGAIDNATGIITLLLLAERMHEYNGALGIEILALNGEDYYAASGEIDYLEKHLGSPEKILLAINIDGAGYQEGQTAYSLYGCPEEMQMDVRTVFETFPDLVEGQPWYQSDHSLFIQKNVPAIAITSDRYDVLWSEIAHTSKDLPNIVDLQKLVDLSAAIHNLILVLDRKN
jgi:aminopeptidase YwaD